MEDVQKRVNAYYEHMPVDEDNADILRQEALPTIIRAIYCKTKGTSQALSKPIRISSPLPKSW